MKSILRVYPNYKQACKTYIKMTTTVVLRMKNMPMMTTKANILYYIIYVSCAV
jgi:hypothetical protein